MQAFALLPPTLRLPADYDAFPAAVGPAEWTEENKRQLLRRERRRLTRLIVAARRRTEQTGCEATVEFELLPHAQLRELRRTLARELLERFPALECWSYSGAVSGQWVNFVAYSHQCDNNVRRFRIRF